MLRISLAALVIAAPAYGFAGERVAGTNSYVLNEERFHAGNLTYWRQDNNGVYEVTEGPIRPGFVRCIGAGFGGPAGVTGDGVCIYGEGEDTFTWRWEAHAGAPNTWEVVGSTGAYAGMKGSGTATSRIASEFTALQHRVTDWEGEITLPE